MNLTPASTHLPFTHKYLLFLIRVHNFDLFFLFGSIWQENELRSNLNIGRMNPTDPNDKLF